MVQGIAQQGACILSAMPSSDGRSSGAAAWANTLLLVLVGCLSAAAVCWPFEFWFVPGQPLWWLQILAMVPLCHALHSSANARQAFGRSAVFATGWLCATFWWLYIAMHIYGGLSAVLTLLAVLALAAALALYYAAAGALYWKLASVRPALAAPAFAALWTMAEMARGTWLTGFGWGAMAYAHIDGPLALWIPVLGAYGVGALAVWCAATLALVHKAGWWQHGLLAILLAAGLLHTVFPLTTSTGSLSVALLQGNIPQDEKFDSGTGVPIALKWYAEQMQRRKVDLVLAPETAIPLLPLDLPEGYWLAMNRQVARGHGALLTGIPLGDYTQGYTNSVIALSPLSPEVWRYDKHHLVPFGEFIPPLFKWFTRMMNIPLGDFNRGAVGQPSFSWKGQRIAPNICYEDLFGEELGARFIDTALAPTVFANVSNLGWFGNSLAIDQHLQISRMRAREFQRPFIRATNTGTTVILDYQGQVQAALPRLTQGVLEGTVEGRSGITPFAWWVARFGLWPLWLLSLAVVAAARWSVAAHGAHRSHRRPY
jgi:apolipoprotein N-acyltransferase